MHHLCLVTGQSPATAMGPFDEDLVADPWTQQMTDAQVLTAWREALDWIDRSEALDELVSMLATVTPELLHDDPDRRQRLLLTAAPLLQEWTGYEYRIDPSSSQLCAVRQDNPHARWDYFEVGGRWEYELVLTELMFDGTLASLDGDLDTSIVEDGMELMVDRAS